MSRTIAIGDIHGCSIALTALIEAISPRPDDIIVPLSDYVDRGIDSKGVLDQLIDLSTRFKLMPILGNHDQMMLHARDGRSDFEFWLNCGADAALDSYGSRLAFTISGSLIRKVFSSFLKQRPHSSESTFFHLFNTQSASDSSASNSSGTFRPVGCSFAKSDLRAEWR